MNNDLSQARPRVIPWFHAYCGLMVVMYMLCIAGGIYFLVVPPAELDMVPLEARITGGLLAGLGVILTIACALPFFVKPKSWVWVYNLVLICLGMTSTCFLPLCIPLLIFWIKGETKAYYKSGNG